LRHGCVRGAAVAVPQHDAEVQLYEGAMTDIAHSPHADVIDARPHSRSTIDRLIGLLSAIFHYGWVAIVLRLLMAQVFFLAGQKMIEGPSFPVSFKDFRDLDFSVTLPMSVKDQTYQAFEQMANLPIPAWIVAPVVAYAEFILPIFLVLGLATRFTAFVLLIGVAAMLYLTGLGSLWSLHIYWISLLLVLVSLGPGVVSIDHVIRYLHGK
jgi:putative oxidoreductase